MHFCVSTVCNPKCRNLFIPFASLLAFNYLQPNLTSKELWPCLRWDMRINVWTSTLTCKVLAYAGCRLFLYFLVGCDWVFYKSPLGLIRGNLRELHFGDIEHVTSDAQCTAAPSLVEDGNTALLMEFDPTNFFIPRKTCLTLLCTLQPKRRERHDFLALRGISISALKFAKRAKLDECRRNIPGAQTKMGKYFYTFGSCLDWYASTLSKDCEGHIPTSDASPESAMSPQSAMDSMLLHVIWNTFILRVFWPILRVKLICVPVVKKMQMLEMTQPLCKALWQVLAIYCNIVIDLLMCLYFITLAGKQWHCLSVFRSLQTQWKEWSQHVTQDILKIYVQAVHLASPFYGRKNKWRVPDFYDFNMHRQTSLL